MDYSYDLGYAILVQGYDTRTDFATEPRNPEDTAELTEENFDPHTYVEQDGQNQYQDFTAGTACRLQLVHSAPGFGSDHNTYELSANNLDAGYSSYSSSPSEQIPVPKITSIVSSSPRTAHIFDHIGAWDNNGFEINYPAPIEGHEHPAEYQRLRFNNLPGKSKRSDSTERQRSNSPENKKRGSKQPKSTRNNEPVRSRRRSERNK
nr:uncharacterized protein CTRU02_15735 [Colletotrichum truncatum]XP_036578831.1 uncharacterized protein CTRU02_11085 [Colletotrichum truncatum]KAF6780707.1 hypothetical protein CTRU02_15735 [Colletotrichum truncatum]KAF6786214.1 hypothetical protein CTRU02_11085 [Colletotrichum truncatum]